MKPRALVVGPLPPPPGGVGRLVEAILASPLKERWTLDVFDLSKPQQEGKPGVVTPWDVAWTVLHLVLLPWRILTRRPRVALVQSTADTGFVRDLALVLVLRAFRVPVVLHWHGPPESTAIPGPDPGSLRSSAFRFAAARARAVMLLAEPYRAFFERHLDPAKLVVVPNFVDGAHIRSFTPVAVRAPGEVRLAFVGRIGPLKGSDVLLDALLRARERVPGLTATLVGDGETPEALAAARAHAAVVAGAARLTGPLGDERFAELAAADVFVQPTRADSFPLSVIEAMAAGLPIVATPLGAIPWLLADGACGALVPVGDADALADAFVRLATDTEARARAAAAARARQESAFDSASAAGKLDTVLREAAGLPT